MICVECRKGGSYLTIGKPALAEAHHDLCRGGTWCDCMHQLTSSLNLDRIKQATMDVKDESPSSK